MPTGSYTLHYADQSIQSVDYDDCNNHSAFNGHNPTTANTNDSANSNIGSANIDFGLNTSYSSDGSLDIVYDENNERSHNSHNGNAPVSNANTSSMNGYYEGNSNHDGEKCQGLLHHGNMDVLSVHVMPAVVIELHDGCVMSHPLNLCPDSL